MAEGTMTGNPWTDEQITALTGAIPGASVVIDAPASGVTHALRSAEARSLQEHMDDCFEGLRFTPCSPFAIEAGELDVEVAWGEDPICAVRSRRGRQLRVIAGGRDAADAAVDPDAPSTAYVKLAAGRWATVLDATTRQGLAVGGTGASLCLQVVHPPLVSPIEAPSPSAPASLAAVTPGWLSQAIQERLARGDTWSQAVAAGLSHRLADLGPADEALVQSVLEGAGPGGWGAAIPWARAQSAAVIRGWETLCVGEAGRLLEALGDLDEELGVLGGDADAWTSSLTRALEARDDAECVRSMLIVAGAGDDARAALGAVDAVGGDLAEITPTRLWPTTARLVAVAEAHPDAWWGAHESDE